MRSWLSSRRRISARSLRRVLGRCRRTASRRSLANTKGGIAQFYDRDMTKEMADEGMKGMQQFISDPSKLDDVLAQLEQTRQRIYKK
jgi:hypothetical protein